MGVAERTEREKAERRKQREELILSRAEALFLEKGFILTTISDIAAACELTNGAIYIYYKNKDELILKVMSGISRNFGDLLETAAEQSSGSPGIEQLHALLNVYNRTFGEYRTYHRLDAEFNIIFCQSYPDSHLLDEYFQANKRVLKITSGVVKCGMQDGSISSGQSSLRTAGMLLNAVNSYVEKISLRKKLMEDEQGIRLEEELDEYIRLLLSGLKSV